MDGKGSSGSSELIKALGVLVVLVGLTVYLTHHYGSNATKAAAVLGVITPVLGAVVGVSIGYSAGKAKGEAGQADVATSARQRLVEHLKDLLAQPDGGAEGVPSDEDPRLARIRQSLAAVETEAPDGGR